jgi:hypothetical protein
MRDLALSDTPLALGWCVEALCVGFRTQYVLLAPATGAVAEVPNPTPRLPAHLGRLSCGGGLPGSGLRLQGLRYPFTRFTARPRTLQVFPSGRLGAVNILPLPDAELLLTKVSPPAPLSRSDIRLIQQHFDSSAHSLVLRWLLILAYTQPTYYYSHPRSLFTVYKSIAELMYPQKLIGLI